LGERKGFARLGGQNALGKGVEERCGHGLETLTLRHIVKHHRPRQAVRSLGQPGDFERFDTARRLTEVDQVTKGSERLQRTLEGVLAN
jgi:hypothetical protein